MSSAQGAFTILNPDVYLNYLTPAAAREYEFSRDIDFTFLGVRYNNLLLLKSLLKKQGPGLGYPFKHP